MTAQTAPLGWTLPRRLAGTMAALAMLAAGAALGQSRAVPVDGGPVKVATVERTVEAVGTLTSNESVVLKPEVAGIVSMITQAEGHFVPKGTVVVQLDDRILQAEYEQVLARFELSRQNLQRAEDLSKKGAGTDRALDEARASHRLNAAALNLAKARLDQTKIVAPFDGVLGLKAVSVGDYLKSGDAVINLESIDPIKVDFRIPEIYLADLKQDQDIAVKVDALPSRAFAGKVAAIDPLIDVNGRSIAIRAVIPNTDRALRPGLFARVDVVLERREKAVMVPEQTLVLSGGKKFVFKVDGGKAGRVEVTTGLRKGADVEITSGLKAGDIVVTSGQGKLRDGDAVDLPSDARS